MAREFIHRLRAFCFAAGVLAGLCMLTFPAAAQQQNPDSSAQQNQPAQPIPAYHSPFVAAQPDEETNTQGAGPDTRPLSGVQYTSAENITNNRSYWQPRFDLSGSGDSNPAEGAASAGWGTWTSFLGGVDIHRTAGASDLLLTYTGGGMYSNDAMAPSGTVQELGLSEKIIFRRSVLSIFDQLSYLPQASLGFGGVGGVPLTGTGPVGLGPGFTAGQSILTGQGQNLSNSSVVQFERFLTPRSSVTMAGGYSLLHFFGNNLLDSGSPMFQGGYNYQLTKHDTLAFLYAFSDFHYTSVNQSIYTHSIEASYGLQVTGRLAFQIAAGPEFAIFNQPTGTSGGTGGGTGASNPSTTNLYWTLNTALNYQYQRTGLGLTYWHGVTAGSGVMAGAVNDSFTGSLMRRMSPMFSNGLTAGYARNSTLPASGSTAPAMHFDYWFAGASLAHPLSDTLAVTLSYQMQYQTTSSNFCIGNSCGTSFLRHLITVGLSWHQRPLLF